MRTHLGFSAQLIMFVLILFLNNRASAAPPLFHVTNLGSLGDDGSYANAVNDYGQVVGGSGNTAFLWTPTVRNGSSGSMVQFGSLPGFGSPEEAYGVNNYGQVVGITTDGSNIGAFLWTPTSSNATTGSTVGIGTVDASMAYGINASGQIALGGFTDPPNSHQTASLWIPNTPNGQMGSIVNLFANTNAGGVSFGINDLGQVFGGSGLSHFVWTPTLPNGSTGAGDFFPTIASVCGINATGDLVGGGAGESHLGAAFWKSLDSSGANYAQIDIGTLTNFASDAFGINDQDEVVGFSDDEHGEPSLAFLWTQGDGIMDLNTLLDSSGANWKLLSAQDINNMGQIVGLGLYDPDGDGPLPAVNRAFLLTPVPEPSSLTLLLTLMAMCLCRNRWRFTSRYLH